MTTTTALVRGTSRSKAGIALDGAFAVLLFATTACAVIAIAALVWTVLDAGLSRLVDDPAAFLANYASRFPARAGVRAALVGSLYLMAVVLATAVPLGLGAAIYLEEFSAPSRLSGFIEANIANLAAVPSVVYGVLGLAVFVRFFGMGPSILAGGLTLALMTLPVVIIASREAIRAVPATIRQGALALGANKWQVVRYQVLPAAAPGIVTGTILGVARALGETAPLLVIGAAVSVFHLPKGLNDNFAALPVLIFTWTSRPQQGFVAAAAAAIIVLLAILAALISVALFVRNRYTIRW